MPITVRELIGIIEAKFSPNLAESWDNVGLQAGDPDALVERLMVVLDVTEEVVDEAVSQRVNMIFSHHPLIFSPVKDIRFDRPMGRILSKIIKNDIAVYAAHTNLDSARGGINEHLARLFNLKNIEVLAPSVGEDLFKLVVFVPEGYLEQVRSALCQAGAGWIGNYSCCTFSAAGEGTFLPLEGTDPFIGTKGSLEKVREYRLETIIPAGKLKRALVGMLESHPYEEVAYDIYKLDLDKDRLGLGRIGELDMPLELHEMAVQVKKGLNVGTVKVVGNLDGKIKRVAVCGGAGASLINQAVLKGADCYITGDLKYHEARDAEAMRLAVIDAGHFNTENFIVPHLCEWLKKEFAKMKADIAVWTSNSITEPWKYC
jgi:dinuclear metal center YbgI/SA1388 family protein